MPAIDKTTITTGKAAIVLISVCSILITGLTVYFTTKQAVMDALNKYQAETREKITQIEKEALVLSFEVRNLRAETHEVKDAFINFVGIRPEEIKRKNYK